MVHLYIDESGSITKKINTAREHFFIISVLHVKDIRALTSSFTRFINSNREELIKLDVHKVMFDSNNKFIELKGSALSPEMKIRFIEHIAKDNIFKVFYVRLDNRKNNNSFVQDKERAFNYILGHLLEYNLRCSYLPQNKSYRLYHDQRSIAVSNLSSLEDYLFIQLNLKRKFINKIKLTYHESQKVKLIQVADLFANILFSQGFTNTYNKLLRKLKKDDYLANTYNFPYR